jgi:hypothetical protein
MQIHTGGSLYVEKGYLPIQRGAKELEFRTIFNGLNEAGQDRLLDTARALSFAAKTCIREGQPEHDKKAEFAAQRDEGQ